MEVFPRVLLTPEKERWRRVATKINGGVTVGNQTLAARTDGGGLWTAQLINIVLDTPEQLRAHEGLVARLEEGVVRLVVPRFAWPYRPVPDGAEWLVSASVVHAAPLRATEIQIAISVGAPLRGGEVFSITHPTCGKRLYTVHSVVDVAGPAQTIRIRPPLREAVTNEPVDFNDPGCVMRLADEDSFVGELDASHSSAVTAVFVEAF